MDLYGVYGLGGCGRGILPLARETLRVQGVPASQLVFIDDRSDHPRTANGHLVLTYSQFKQESAGEKHAAIAVADGMTRAKLAQRLEADGVAVWSVAAANVVIMDAVEIGPGAILSPFVTLTSNISIGRCFHANLYSYVEHDCEIGDFVTFAPGVMCNGNVRICDHAYVGAGAMIRQGRPGKPLVIGRGAVVGMGAVVTKDVPPGATVVGNPARPLAKSNQI